MGPPPPTPPRGAARSLLTLNESLRAIEKEVGLEAFYGAGSTASELTAKPLVLVIGQYSTGKTTFISTLCGHEYDGAHIGPEPTTEKFVAVVGVGRDQPRASKRGNYVSMMPGLPFGGLARYGQAFLSKFVAAFEPDQSSEEGGESLVQKVTFVDTPGVLSGEKQRVNRSYDFATVSRWFAERAELVLLVFDAHKLDISDEFRDIIAGLKGYEGRVRCVLNKADQVDSERLVRVYGALMFNIGKILQTPEVIRVFIGSFWDEPLRHAEYEQVFAKDRAALVDEIQGLERSAAARKLDDLVRRGRLALLHCRLCAHIRARYAPGALTRLLVPGAAARAKARCIAELDDVYAEVLRRYGKEVSAGDLPPKDVFLAGLAKCELHQLPWPDEATTVDDLKYWLAEEIPRATGFGEDDDDDDAGPEASHPQTTLDDDLNLSDGAKARRRGGLGAKRAPAAALVPLAAAAAAFVVVAAVVARARGWTCEGAATCAADAKGFLAAYAAAGAAAVREAGSAASAKAATCVRSAAAAVQESLAVEAVKVDLANATAAAAEAVAV